MRIPLDHAAPRLVVLAATAMLGGTGLGQEPAPRTTLRGAVAEVRFLAFSPDGKVLASASESETLPQTGEVRLWDLASGKGTVLLERPGRTDWLIAFSRDGRLATGGPEGITLWDVSTRKEKQTFKGHKPSCLAFSPDGKVLAVGGMKTGLLAEDVFLRTDQVKLLDVESGKSKADLEEGRLGGVGAVAFSPDGGTLASAVLSLGPVVVLWDVAAGKPKVTLRGRKVITCLAFRPDGKMLATGDEEGTIRLWDVATGKVAGILHGHTDWVGAVQFTPDGRTLASGSTDGTVRLWDVEMGEKKAILRGHEGKVAAVAVSPDGRVLASAGADKIIRLWDLPGRAKKDD